MDNIDVRARHSRAGRYCRSSRKIPRERQGRTLLTWRTWRGMVGCGRRWRRMYHRPRSLTLGLYGRQLGGYIEGVDGASDGTGESIREFAVVPIPVNLSK